VRATRRAALKGALAVPVAATVPTTARARGGGTVLVHDPALAAGRRLAGLHDGEVLAIAGDRIRFARALFAARPSLVLGLTRAADALLLEDVGREVGYKPVAAPGGLGASGWALAPHG
jgi:hypothetical protein